MAVVDRLADPVFRHALAEAKRRGLKLSHTVVRTVIPKEFRTLTFVEFVNKVKPSFKWYAHNVKVAKVLQRVADRELTRVMFFWPPRHGKTEQISRLFSAYWLYRYPHQWVGINSYAAELAHGLSYEAQVNFVAGGGRLNNRVTAQKHWRTYQGGGMWAAGVGGPITGKGFHLGIIDDPLKNAEEANSEVIRKKQIEWFQSTFYTRAEPGEAIVVIQTRWHEGDLSGWLLEQEKAADEDDDELGRERWHIVNFQAIRDLDEEPEFPASCTVEEDWRQHGEPLCPERYPLNKLQRIAKRIGEYFFAALFQQKPVPAGGGILKAIWFRHRIHISQLPKMVKMVGAADLAITAKDSADFTVFFPMGVDRDGRYYLFRPYRAQAEAPDAQNGVVARSLECHPTAIGVESVAYQMSFVQHLRQRVELNGTPIIPLEADMDKEARARGWAPIAEQGLITLVSDGSGWEDTFLDEATKFPRSKWKDQVDTVGLCFALLRKTSQFSAAAGAEPGTTDIKSQLR